MIHLPASVRVYVCLTPTDMRRSFDGLQAQFEITCSWTPSPDICTFSATEEKIDSK